jgi:hypothetical protein
MSGSVAIVLLTLLLARSAPAEPRTARERTFPVGVAPSIGGTYQVRFPGWKAERVTSSDRTGHMAQNKDGESFWYDFFPGIDVDYAKRMIASGSMDVMGDIVPWRKASYDQVAVGGQAGLQVTSEHGFPNRAGYLVPLPSGVFAIHVMGGFDATSKQPPALVAKVLAAFRVSPRGLTQARRRGRSAVRPPLRDPVPTTVEQCFPRLKKRLSPPQLRRLRQLEGEFDAASHYPFNDRELLDALVGEWGLRWKHSPLARFFVARGVTSFVDMMKVIIVCFWRHLGGRPVDVPGAIRYVVPSSSSFRR